jgi:hypothetical protein
MPKKYRIKPSEKCQSCEKAADCEQLKQLYQKPFDASAILVDCNAFYIVFCELEERCRIPFGDSEKMKQYHKDLEAGKRPFLDPAMVTNGMLAAELALKALIFIENGCFDCIHEIDTLFYSLPEPHQEALLRIIKEKTTYGDNFVKSTLEIYRNAFNDWRYFFGSDSVGFNDFMSKFIHIVCDYAIAQFDNDSSEVMG